MNEKIETLKMKARKYAPVIIAATTSAAIAAVTTAIYFRKTAEDMTFGLTDEDLDAMSSGESDMRYSIKGSDYALRYIGNTPQTED